MNVLEVELNAWRHANLAIITRLIAELAATKQDPNAWVTHFEADCQDGLKGIGSGTNSPDDALIQRAAANIVQTCMQAARHRPPS